MEQQLKAAKEAKIKVEQDFQRINDEFTTFRSAAEQREKEKNAKLSEQAELATARGGELERTRSELDVIRAESGKSQEQLDVLAARELTGMPADDVVIIGITYADVHLYRLGDNPPSPAAAAVLDNMKKAMRTGTEYTWNEFWAARAAGLRAGLAPAAAAKVELDPKFGVPKTLVVLYRYNTAKTPNKGVRTWIIWDGGKAKFDVFA
jgi:hypothetical protein